MARLVPVCDGLQSSCLPALRPGYSILYNSPVTQAQSVEAVTCQTVPHMLFIFTQEVVEGL